eukprot:863966_1
MATGGVSLKDMSAMNKRQFKEWTVKENERRRRVRERITLIHSPFKAIDLFGRVCWRNLCALLYYCLTHRLTTFCFVPLFIIYAIGRFFPGSHQPMFEVFEEQIIWSGWWIGLGVLSSVGLGTGMHSGILFLFPHIAEVCLAATECESLNFATHGPRAFLCPDSTMPVTFFGIFKKVFFACLRGALARPSGRYLRMQSVELLPRPARSTKNSRNSRKASPAGIS